MPLLTEWARLILAVFVCYRLAQLVTYDEGPFSVFLKLRRRAGCYDYAQNGEPKKAIGRFLRCPYCMGVWFAILSGALVIWPTVIGDFFLLWLGIAGAQNYLEVRKDGER